MLVVNDLMKMTRGRLAKFLGTSKGRAKRILKGELDHDTLINLLTFRNERRKPCDNT